MKLKEFLKKWCMPDTRDESVKWQFNEDLDKLDIQEEIILEKEWECAKHKSDLPCEECERESEQDYVEMEEEEDREQEFFYQGDENV